jgi:transcriptional regulator with XRE-family HTH domain
MTTNSTTERVKVLIKQVGLKQGDFAEQCGITPQSFSRAIKNGFSVEYLMRIANTFKANYKWLYNGIGEMFAEEKAIGKAQFAAFNQMLNANSSPVSQNVISGYNYHGSQTINATEGKITALEQKIEALTQLLAEKDKLIASQQAWLADKDKLITRQEAEIAELRERLKKN